MPADVPRGDPRVFDAIVRTGPRVLLGGDVPLVDLLRHELGHAVELHRPAFEQTIAGWSSLTGWREDGDEIADGFVGGGFASEQPIVASRLVLALPRGAGSYVLHGSAPTGYAAFDPMEDFAEAFRLAHADPVALGTRSPVRLLAIGVPLGAPLRRFIAPAIRALLAPDADPIYAMAIVRAYGTALLPEAAAFDDARPLPIPSDLDPKLRAYVDPAQLVVEMDGHRIRPTDVQIARYLTDIATRVRDMEEFDRGLR